MFYSGLVVTCAPQDFDVVQSRLQACNFLDIHQTDPNSGRLVVTIVEPTIEAETERFQSIRQLPGVVDVSLVVHRQDDEA